MLCTWANDVEFMSFCVPFTSPLLIARSCACACARVCERERKCYVGLLFSQRRLHAGALFLLSGGNFTYENNRLVSASLFDEHQRNLNFSVFFFATAPSRSISHVVARFTFIAFCLKLNWIAMKTKGVPESLSKYIIKPNNEWLNALQSTLARSSTRGRERKKHAHTHNTVTIFI